MLRIWLYGLIPSLFLIGSASAQEAKDAFEAHLAAGEFGPARAAALEAKDATTRDHRLAALAKAQATSGARRAALDSAFDIGSDTMRASALRSSPGPMGVAPGRFGRGGGVIADFDSLIDLITTTVAPQSWDEVGGPGAISEFATGVYVEPSGVMKRVSAVPDLSLLRERKAAIADAGNRDPRKTSRLRKISLTRLEKAAQLRSALGKGPDEVMALLAGLERIQYVFVYPESGDIVLAGPAGDWRRDEEGRFVSHAGKPVVHLDDLVVTLRHAWEGKDSLGCAIKPTEEGLAAVQVAHAKWPAGSIKSDGQRERWLGDLRTALGKQNIEVWGIDPRTRTARVLVEADYRMKLVGMGLEKGVLGVTSYLDSIELKPGEAAPPMDVLRWWFTLNYDALTATDGHDAFQLRGPGVKVLSENELLTAKGERVHTGKSSELNAQFAQAFTKHFEALAAKYPIYADMRNVFDLAVVGAILKAEDIPGQVGWHLTHFGPQGDYAVALEAAPTQVDSVMNYRVINGKATKTIVAGVSGGVSANPRALVGQGFKPDTYGLLKPERSGGVPKELPRGAWWWD